MPCNKCLSPLEKKPYHSIGSYVYVCINCGLEHNYKSEVITNEIIEMRKEIAENDIKRKNLDLKRCGNNE